MNSLIFEKAVTLFLSRIIISKIDIVSKTKFRKVERFMKLFTKLNADLDFLDRQTMKIPVFIVSMPNKVSLGSADSDLPYDDLISFKFSSITIRPVKIIDNADCFFFILGRTLSHEVTL